MSSRERSHIIITATTSTEIGKQQSTSQLIVAREYIEGGISVIPLKLDGSKSPDVPSWNEYRERFATDEELVQWFGDPRRLRGIGIPCGVISGGLEGIDFDMAETFNPWWISINPTTRDKLTVCETPGGFHVLYRCIEICGNRKLAMWEDPASPSQKQFGYRDGTGLESIGKGVRIETRGEGGYLVAEGSPLEVHPSGLPYCHAFGWRLPHVQYIEPEERAAIWRVAMQFDCGKRESAAVKRAIQEEKRRRFGPVEVTGDEPWTWYDRNGDWYEILSPHGWRSIDGVHWTRPGKNFGTSATVNQGTGGDSLLTVFTTSAGPLGPMNGESHATHGMFSAYAILNHGGDRRAAARAVREMMRTGVAA